MPTRKMMILGIAAVLAVFLCVVAIFWCQRGALLPYHTRSYHGDGMMTDSGFWSRPRYRISMPKVLLAATQRHTYTLDGVPTVDFIFGLQVLNEQGHDVPTDDFASVHNELSITISVKITNAQGETVYVSSSPIQKWHLSGGGGRAYLWLDGYDIRLKRGQRYSLDLEISAESVNATRALVEPFLAGGGNELP